MTLSPISSELNEMLSVSPAKPKGEKHLISIGVDRYIDFQGLNNSVNECEFLIDFFEANRFCLKQNIVPLFNEDASKEAIVNVLSDVWDKVKDEDSIVFHFAGHGYFDGNQNYIVPTDAHSNHLNDFVPSELLAKFIRSSKVKNSMFIVNACFSGAAFNQIQSYDFLKHFTPKQEKLFKDALDLDLSNQSFGFRNTFFEFLKTKDDHDKKTKLITFFYRQKENVKIPADTNLIFTSVAEKRQTIPESKNHNHLLREVKKGNFKNVYTKLKSIAIAEQELLKNYSDNLIIKQLLTKEQAYELVPKELDISRRKRDYEDALTIFKELGITILPLPDGNDSAILKKPEEKIKILFAQASPEHEDHRLFIEEVKKIEDELKKARFREHFEIKKLYDTSISALESKLLEFEPHIIHFRGSQDGNIHLFDHQGDSKIIPPNSLAKFLELFSDKIHCVLLTSNHSSINCGPIKRCIARVIGMKGMIDKNATFVFCSTFYKALGAGKPIDFAFSLAINSIDTNQMKGSEIPLLL